MTNMSMDEINKFNQTNTDWWDLKGSFKPLHDINMTRMNFIAHYAQLEHAKFLDVGCGGGIVAESLAKRHAQVTGIDMAENALMIARQHAGDLKIDYQFANVEALSLEIPASFDGVTCLEMLEHVPDPYSIIKACADLVKPNGAVFFSTLNRSFKAKALGVLAAEKLLKLVPEGTHDFNKFIRPSELAQYCEHAGLKVKVIKGITYNPFTRVSYLSDDLSINYIVYAQKEAQ